MSVVIECLLLAVILANLRLLGSSRLDVCIQAIGLQGALLSLMSLALNHQALSGRIIFLSAASLAIKGIAFPWWLTRSVARVKVGHELQPLVGYSASVLIGMLGLLLSVWLGRQLPLHRELGTLHLIPVALMTVMVGLFLIVARRRALTQVVGYLALENGIYAFGAAVLVEAPLLVEFGVLLDVFVAVFVMGIAVFHISEDFDHIDTSKLTTLRE